MRNTMTALFLELLLPWSISLINLSASQLPYIWSWYNIYSSCRSIIRFKVLLGVQHKLSASMQHCYISTPPPLPLNPIIGFAHVSFLYGKLWDSYQMWIEMNRVRKMEGLTWSSQEGSKLKPVPALQTHIQPVLPEALPQKRGHILGYLVKSSSAW